MTPILIPSYRANGDWGDLQLAVLSLSLYAPEHELVVGWRGPTAPLLPDGVTSWERPESVASSAEAVFWLAAKTGAEEFVVWSDDCVAQPDTILTLIADVAAIRARVDRVGIVGCRSNFAGGVQNVRSPNGSQRLGLKWESEDQILEVPFVAPFVAWYAAEHLAGLTAPTFEFYSDNWHCDVLRQRGYCHFVSRAYVHHVGMRSSQAAGLTLEEVDRTGFAGLQVLQQGEVTR